MPKPTRNAGKKQSIKSNASSRNQSSPRKSSFNSRSTRDAKPAGKSSASKSSKAKATAKAVSNSVTSTVTKALSNVASQARKAARSAEETDFRGGVKRVGSAIASATRTLTSKLHLPKASPKSSAKAKASDLAAAAGKLKARKQTSPTPAVRNQAPKAQPAKQATGNRTPSKARTPPASAKPAPRSAKRTPDIEFGDLAKNYTPAHTSLKSSFREAGVARTEDQDMAGGFSDERWNDEDHFTNKSGDPRIGTHGRTYEPDEEPARSRK